MAHSLGGASGKIRFPSVAWGPCYISEVTPGRRDPAPGTQEVPDYCSIANRLLGQEQGKTKGHRGGTLLWALPWPQALRFKLGLHSWEGSHVQGQWGIAVGLPKNGAWQACRQD